MKTSIFKTLFCAAALLFTFTACTDNPDYPGDEKTKMGSVKLSDIDVTVDTSEEEISRADMDVSNFLIKIFDASGKSVYESTFAQRAEVLTLPVATGYTVQVENQEVQNAAWSSPYYAGKKTFDVKENDITDIGTINCVFANIRVTIKYTDELRKMMGSDVNVNVACSQTGSSLDFKPDETRSGYFRALSGSTTLGASFTGTILNQYVSITKALNNIAAGQHRIITFSVKGEDPDIPDEYGSISISGTGTGVKIAEGLYLDISVTTVDVDGNVTIEEQGDSEAKRPGEDVTPPDPPIGEVITMTSSTLNFTTPMNPATITSGVLNIHADNGIKNLIVKISTTSSNFEAALEDVGMPTEFDLAYPKEGEETIFSSFGFPYGSAVQGANDVVFDITNFIPLLLIYEGTHTFTITVNDVDSNTLTKNLTFLVVK